MSLPRHEGELLDEYLDELARRLFVAIMSLQAGVTYQTAERNFGHLLPPRNSRWHTLADIAVMFIRRSG